MLSHSGAPRSGEPGTHNHGPRVMDSGLATLRVAPRNDSEDMIRLIRFTESAYYATKSSIEPDRD